MMLKNYVNNLQMNSEIAKRNYSNCKEKIEGKATFCENCGAKIQLK